MSILDTVTIRLDESGDPHFYNEEGSEIRGEAGGDLWREYYSSKGILSASEFADKYPKVIAQQDNSVWLPGFDTVRGGYVPIPWTGRENALAFYSAYADIVKGNVAEYNGVVYLPRDTLMAVGAVTGSSGFIQGFLDSGGGVFALIGAFIAITAAPALMETFGFSSPSGAPTFGDNPEFYADPGWSPISPPNNVPMNTFESLSPGESVLTPEPVTVPEPVTINDIPLEYPMPAPTEPPPIGMNEGTIPVENPGWDIPSTAPGVPTLPPQTTPGTLPKIGLPTLSDLPKLLTAATGAALALQSANAKKDLQEQLLRSSAINTQPSLLYNTGLNPIMDSGGAFGQTLSNFVKSPWFWLAIAGGAVVIISANR